MSPAVRTLLWLVLVGGGTALVVTGCTGPPAPLEPADLDCRVDCEGGYSRLELAFFEQAAIRSWRGSSEAAVRRCLPQTRWVVRDDMPREGWTHGAPGEGVSVHILPGTWRKRDCWVLAHELGHAATWCAYEGMDSGHKRDELWYYKSGSLDTYTGRIMELVCPDSF